MNKKIYIVGIGGIGISGIARYYLHKGYEVYGSDMHDSELIGELQKEGAEVIIGVDENRITKDFDLIVYTEAVPKSQKELQKARELGTKIQTFPQALAEVINDMKLITVAGTHGKSTTSSLISLVLKDSDDGVNSLVGTLLKEFDNKNTYFSDSEYFVLEACEYNRSFLNYKPTVAVITNIDLDHLDYYKDLDDYVSAFKSYIDNVKKGGFVILNGDDKNCKKLIGLREDINYIVVNENNFYFENNGNKEILEYPKFTLKVPGKHILFDAKIAYVVGYMVGITDDEIIKTLQNYNGIWRRSEMVGETKNQNIIMSDYGHHPTEISLTLDALKERYPEKKLFVVFQPHQYNRTLNLIDGFKTCFKSADTLIIPDIYESRDSEEDKKKLNSKILSELIEHKNVIDGNGMKNTLDYIKNYDKKNPNSSIIMLQGAGNVDDLRFDLVN